jgi:NADH-quinone oxidoreductase subunit A
MEDLASLASVVLTALAAGLLLPWLVARAERRASSWPQRAPFTGGGALETHAWSRFHVRYYPMTLVFVAFEMEMMFMYPWAVVFVEEGGKALAEMGMFLTLLGVGLVYAWREGAFRWQ